MGRSRDSYICQSGFDPLVYRPSDLYCNEEDFDATSEL